MVSEFAKEEEFYGYEQEVEEKLKKVAKFKRKLNYERNKGNLLNYVIVFSWVMITVLCIVLAMSCSPTKGFGV